MNLYPTLLILFALLACGLFMIGAALVIAAEYLPE